MQAARLAGMKSVLFARARFSLSLGLVFLTVLGTVTVHASTDPNLSITTFRIEQSVVLRWYGSNAVSYQLEASPDSQAWTNAGPILIGSNLYLFSTNSTVEGDSGFFRVKRLIPDDPWTASFDPWIGLLSIVGNDLDNNIAVGRDVAGSIRINGGTVPIAGGSPTVSNTFLIQIFGRAGNDQLLLDETYGPLPKANMFGEIGDDTLTGGSGPDTLNGGPGNDTLFGKGGLDNLIGGDDHDTAIGGDADDNIQLGNGNDRAIWDPGHDTDLIEGGDGADTVEVNGGGGSEEFTVMPNVARVRLDRLNPAPFFLDMNGCEKLELHANGGDDTLTCTGNLAAVVQITADGGPGQDTLLGSNGNDVLTGGEGNDFIDGQQGADTVLMGDGDDVVQWDPGDGSDIIEGEAGNDTLLFNGSNAAEMFAASASGTRVLFTRNLGGIAMDLNDVETLNLNTLGNTDTVVVSDLSDTELTIVNVNLGLTIGGATGDAAADTILVNGTSNDDIIEVFGAGTSASVMGLSVQVNLTNSDGTNDSVFINALEGDDAVTATTLPVNVVRLTLDGGADSDTLFGSQGNDVFYGGQGDDFIFGDNGNDLVFMGDHDDVFQWDPGDGNDTLEGQGGNDTLQFYGDNIAENIDLFANGARLNLFRNVTSVLLDCDDVENVRVSALEGSDNIVVGELTATDVNGVFVDLAGLAGSGDAGTDSVTVNGTQTNEDTFVAGGAGAILVTGLSASVTVTNAEAAADNLIINALGGIDVVDASDLATNVVRLTINGGLGNDTLIGSQGNDLFNGGDGDDEISGSDGNDTLVWNPGDDNDSFEGEAGTDTLQFNGANIAENISLTAIGGRLFFNRDIANVVMDCNDVESVRFEAVGGADNVTINDLSGTTVTAVNVNLASTVGGANGDTQIDNIYVHGTGANDVATVAGSAGMMSVVGLAATVTLTSCETANDRMTLLTFAGDDVVNASLLSAGVIGLTVDGGDHSDTLTGSDGIDTLLGGNGDDVLIGGPGVDFLDGGAGNNTIIQD